MHGHMVGISKFPQGMNEEQLEAKVQHCRVKPLLQISKNLTGWGGGDPPLPCTSEGYIYTLTGLQSRKIYVNSTENFGKPFPRNLFYIIKWPVKGLAVLVYGSKKVLIILHLKIPTAPSQTI